MKDSLSYEKAKVTLSDFLQQNGMRKTPERYAILEKIYEQEKDFDVHWLHQEMQKEYRVSLGTVYATLNLLQNCHLIIKHQLCQREVRYEKRIEKKNTQQYICTQCGTKKDFIAKPIRTTIQKKRFSNFEASHYSLYVYGLCGKCIRKNNFHNQNKKQVPTKQ